MLTYSSFIPTLLDSVPDLAPVFNEHLRDNGEMLPHVFLGDVTRFVESEFAALLHDDTNGRHSANVRAALDLLEAALKSGDSELENLVGVSFVENLDRESPHYPALRTHFGPAILRECTTWDRPV